MMTTPTTATTNAIWGRALAGLGLALERERRGGKGNHRQRANHGDDKNGHRQALTSAGGTQARLLVGRELARSVGVQIGLGKGKRCLQPAIVLIHHKPYPTPQA